MNRADIRAALDAATPGPWKAVECYSDECRVVDVEGVDLARGCSCDYATLNPADAHLIANAPTWLADLLAAVERVRDQHRPHPKFRTWCAECSVPSPCATLLALDGTP